MLESDSLHRIALLAARLGLDLIEFAFAFGAFPFQSGASVGHYGHKKAKQHDDQ